MDDAHPFRYMSIGCPIPEIRLFQTLTLKLQAQANGCGQRAKSYSPRSIISMCFLFISHQSDQQFLRYSYFEIWPWNIQGQGHEWGQRSKWYIIPSNKPMHFLFISHWSDQQFLWYGKKLCLTLKKNLKILKIICQNNSFQQNIFKIWPGNTHDWCNNLMMTMMKMTLMKMMILLLMMMMTMMKMKSLFHKTRRRHVYVCSIYALCILCDSSASYFICRWQSRLLNWTLLIFDIIVTYSCNT